MKGRNVSEKRTGVGHAQYLDSFGFNVLPAGLGQKIPQVTWAEYQHQRTTPQLRQWFKGRRRNYLVITGSVSRLVVLDLDDQRAEQYWYGVLGDDLYNTARVKTSKGFHAWWRLPEGQTAPRNVSRDDETGKWDLRGEGGLVVAPPSVHASGHVYEWIEGCEPEHIAEVPTALLLALSNTGDAEGPQVRSMLSDLLGNPPDGTGNRNDWLSRVAGHYASMFSRFKDLYEQHVELANQMMAEPLDDAEVRKVTESIWRAEHRKLNGPEPSAENGWLYGRDGRLFSWEKIPQTRPAEYAWLEWADFDLEALGAMTDEHGRVSWRVRVNRADGTSVECTLAPSDLGTSQRFSVWMAGYKCSIPVNDHMKGGITTRILRYLKAQNPPEYQEARWLGWHKDQGFVTKDGVITKDGKQGFSQVAPSEHLLDQPWDYGMGDFHTARELLSEVLTFHDETVTAVYGAWWAACLLKPQIQSAAGGMFPIMALEAPSESGKTTGFFGLMMELAGFTGTQGSYTRAAVQSALSVHANGPVWTDDMTDTSDLNEIIRQAAFGGSRTKKDADRHSQINEVFRAPWVLTGEALNGLDTAKALRDRVISLDVPSPTGRMSKHDPNRTQWSDIEALREQFRLQEYSGTFVQQALKWMEKKGNAPTVAIPRLRVEGTDRRATKLAVIRYGARLLKHLSGEDWVVALVDQWTAELGVLQEGDNDDALLLTVLPVVLRGYGVPESAGLDANGPIPVFRDEETGSILFNIPALADAFARHQRSIMGKVEPHIHSPGALQRQVKSLGLDSERHRKQVRIPRTNKNVRYWVLPREISERVLLRSETVYSATPSLMEDD